MAKEPATLHEVDESLPPVATNILGPLGSRLEDSQIQYRHWADQIVLVHMVMLLHLLRHVVWVVDCREVRHHQEKGIAVSGYEVAVVPKVIGPTASENHMGLVPST